MDTSDLVTPTEAVTRPPESHPTLRRSLRDFILIVASVLTAMAAHDWRNAYAERSREQLYIEQLLIDIEEMEARLAAAIAEEEVAGATTLQILEALNSGEPVSEDSLRAWMTPPRWPFWYSDPRFVMGTVLALQHTGDLSLVRDHDLRLAISAYESDMDAEWEEFGRWVEQAVLGMNTFYDQGSRVAGPYPVGELPEERSVRAAVLFRALMPDPSLRGTLNNLQNARRNRVFYLQRMRDATEHLHRAILDA